MGKATYAPRAPGSFKFCNHCLRELPIANYGSNKAAKDRLDTYCKECKHAVQKKITVDLEDGDLEVGDVSPLTGKPAGIPANILNGIKVPKETVSPCFGVWTWRTPKNWCVLAIHHSADPKKRAGTPDGDLWIAQEAAKMSPRDWQREMNIDNTISEGEPFYTSFNRAVHVRPLSYDPDAPLLVSLDFGRGHPAAIFAQKTRTNQVRVLWSLMETQKSIFDFMPMILAEVNARYPGALVHYYGDPAGAQETDKGATTQILLNEFKVKVNFRFSFIEEGLKMIERALLVRADGEAGLLIDPCNTVLIDAFAGGYKLDSGASGKDTEGRLKNSPKKDGYFDHLCDALRYLFINLFTIAPTSDQKDKALSAVSLWMTNAQIKEKQEEENAVGDFFT